MLQIEEWFRRAQKRPAKRAVSASRPAAVTHRQAEVHTNKAKPKQREPIAEPDFYDEPEYLDKPEDMFKPKETAQQPAEPMITEKTPVQEEILPEEQPDEPVQEEILPEEQPDELVQAQEILPEEQPDEPMTAQDESAQETTLQEETIPEEQPVQENASVPDGQMMQEEAVTLQDSVAETDELEHISQKIGMDVSDMIDLEKEDVLIQQIDEFREKAKQLQQLLQSRESKAKELQEVVDERSAKANSLDRMVHARRGEADKIMQQVSQRIDEMSVGVRTEMNGLSSAVSKEVGGMTQNLTQNIAHEISQSTEKTRQVVEAATQNMIDQNTRSLEGLKEQLDQLNHAEQIGELSTEMNSQMTTLKSDIVEKIHAEDVKCYRNIQVSLDEQSKLLSESDEKIRGQLDEQMDQMKVQMNRHAAMIKASLVISVLNLLGIGGIIALLIIR